MEGPNSFWNPVDAIVGLFTKEGRRDFARFVLTLAAGAAILTAGTYLLTGTGPLQIIEHE